MKFTLVQAARETGRDRSTLFRAIKKGKLSGEKQEDGSYLIDSSELFRVYPEKQLDSAKTQGAQVELHQSAQGTLVDALREQIELLRDQLDRERQQADHWRQQATMLLTHQQEKPEEKLVKSLLWEKLFRKNVSSK
jgi:hypothetical protein